MTQRTITSWVEVPVTNMEKSVKFYNEVFGYDMTIDNSGPNPMAVFGGVMAAGGGHLYPGKPSPDSGSTVHLAIEGSLEAGMERVTKAGGQVVSPIVEIPDGRFVYAKDLDGNSIGLFAEKA